MVHDAEFDLSLINISMSGFKDQILPGQGVIDTFLNRPVIPRDINKKRKKSK